MVKRQSNIFRDYLKEKASIAFEVDSFNEFEAFIESKTLKHLYFMRGRLQDCRYYGPRRFDYYGRSFVYQKYTSRCISGELTIRGESKKDLYFKFNWNPMTKQGNCIKIQKENTKG